MAYKYSIQAEKEDTARVVGTSLPISRKQGIEICNYIRRKTVSKAKQMLEEVMVMDRHVPFKRFTSGAGHKKGIEKGPGKYPIKASKEILNILKSAESNAQFKGLNVESLVIKHISCQQASQSYKQSRLRGRKSKSAHIEVIVQETEKSKPKKKEGKSVGKKETEKKAEVKEKTEAVKPVEKKETKEEKATNKIEEKKAEESQQAIKNIEPTKGSAESANAEAEDKKKETKERAAMPKEQKNELK